MSKNKPTYNKYLQLNKILNGQKRLSNALKEPIHDEMLFIIIHQVYELWFKQIIHEIQSVIKYFNVNDVKETSINTIVSRLERINDIQKITIDQIHVLESMTPMDFLEFRDLLSPASGFQSVQFRIIENLLGLKRKNRLKFSKQEYTSFLSENDKKIVEDCEKGKTLFDVIESWLERMPFLETKTFNFWKSYKGSVYAMLENDMKIIKNNPNLSDLSKKDQTSTYNNILNDYELLFDDKKYQKLLDSGSRKISQKASLSALFIMLYREEPILQSPYRLLTKLIDIDHSLNNWRYSHALLAKRMIGSKIGTGGSSGYSYLKKTMEKHNIFDDFSNLTTYIIPKSKLFTLPEQLKSQLGYYFNSKDKNEK